MIKNCLACLLWVLGTYSVTYPTSYQTLITGTTVKHFVLTQDSQILMVMFGNDSIICYNKSGTTFSQYQLFNSGDTNSQITVNSDSTLVVMGRENSIKVMRLTGTNLSNNQTFAVGITLKKIVLSSDGTYLFGGGIGSGLIIFERQSGQFVLVS